MKRARTWVDFNQQSLEESARKKGKIKQKQVVLDFINDVEETLNRRKGETCIDEFNLLVKFNRFNREEGDFYVDRWLNYAINSQAKELKLSHLITTDSRYEKEMRYVLTEALYRSTSLETLDLFGCRFVKPNCGITLCLRKLKLCRVTIDQQTLQDVVASCCNLEELCIELCDGFDVARFNTGDKLEVVDLYLERDKAQMVAIWAPNVRCLSYGGGFESVQDSFLASGPFNNVKELRFHDVSLEEGFLEVIEDFPGLEKLVVDRCGLDLDDLQLDRKQILSLIDKFALDDSS